MAERNGEKWILLARQMQLEIRRLKGINAELLVACEEALSYFEAMWSQSDNHPADSMADYTTSLRAAIDKARG